MSSFNPANGNLFTGAVRGYPARGGEWVEVSGSLGPHHDGRIMGLLECSREGWESLVSPAESPVGVTLALEAEGFSTQHLVSIDRVEPAAGRRGSCIRAYFASIGPIGTYDGAGLEGLAAAIPRLAGEYLAARAEAEAAEARRARLEAEFSRALWLAGFGGGSAALVGDVAWTVLDSEEEPEAGDLRSWTVAVPGKPGALG